MRFLAYIIIALLVAFQANGQGKRDKKNRSKVNNKQAQQMNTGQTETADPGTVVIAPDEHAALPGGPTDFRVYVQRNMRYPQTAIADQVQGRVMVVATIDPTGRVINAEIQNGVREDLNQEALRLVREMPLWVPAKQGGKAVTSKAVVMVPFLLDQSPEPFK